MIRDDILNRLSVSQDSETTKSLARTCFDSSAPEHLAVIELLCMYSSEITPIEDGWSVRRKSKTGKVLAMIDNYSMSTGKRIFRLAAALQDLPPHEHPTQEEIEKTVELSNGKYKLLPNAMVKRNT